MWFQRARTALARLALSLAIVFLTSAARAQSVDLVAAGSLNLALSQVADAFLAKTGIKVTQTYGPSGTLRQQIEGGLRPDVFASADTASPRALAREGLAGPVQVFARNQIVAVVRSGFGQTAGQSNLLDVLLDPATRIGTSTPVADPLGDYTQRVFQKADAIVPGAEATLEAKAAQLVGGNPSTPGPDRSQQPRLLPQHAADCRHFHFVCNERGSGTHPRSHAADHLSAPGAVGRSAIRADGIQQCIVRWPAIRRLRLVSARAADPGHLWILARMPLVGSELFPRRVLEPCRRCLWRVTSAAAPETRSS